jgi:hypothetical protein
MLLHKLTEAMLAELFGNPKSGGPYSLTDVLEKTYGEIIYDDFMNSLKGGEYGSI